MIEQRSFLTVWNVMLLSALLCAFFWLGFWAANMAQETQGAETVTSPQSVRL
jgi:hypothetical protein